MAAEAMGVSPSDFLPPVTVVKKVGKTTDFQRLLDMIDDAVKTGRKAQKERDCLTAEVERLREERKTAADIRLARLRSRLAALQHLDCSIGHRNRLIVDCVMSWGKTWTENDELPLEAENRALREGLKPMRQRTLEGMTCRHDGDHAGAYAALRDIGNSLDTLLASPRAERRPR